MIKISLTPWIDFNEEYHHEFLYIVLRNLVEIKFGNNLNFKKRKNSLKQLRWIYNFILCQFKRKNLNSFWHFHIISKNIIKA